MARTGARTRNSGLPAPHAGAARSAGRHHGGRHAKDHRVDRCGGSGALSARGRLRRREGGCSRRPGPPRRNHQRRQQPGGRHGIGVALVVGWALPVHGADLGDAAEVAHPPRRLRARRRGRLRDRRADLRGRSRVVRRRSATGGLGDRPAGPAAAPATGREAPPSDAVRGGVRVPTVGRAGRGRRPVGPTSRARGRLRSCHGPVQQGGRRSSLDDHRRASGHAREERRRAARRRSGVRLRER